MFVLTCFSIENFPWENVQDDLLLLYANPAVKHGWPLIMPERYYNKILERETSRHQYVRNARSFGLSKVPTVSELYDSKVYIIEKTFEEDVISRYESKEACLNDLLTNENQDVEDYYGSLLDKIANDANEKIKGILIFEFLPKAFLTSAEKRGIPVVFQHNGLLRSPVYMDRQNPSAFMVNNMAVVMTHGLDINAAITERYNKFLTQYKGLPILSRKGLWRLFVRPSYRGDFRKVCEEPEYDIGVIHNNLGTEISFLGQTPLSDTEMSLKAKEKYKKVLVRGRGSMFAQYMEEDAFDDSPSCFHFALRCKRIVSSMSKGTFEAMLIGRPAHDFNEFILGTFTNKGLDENKGIAPIQYLNFMLFAVWAPISLMTDRMRMERLVAGAPERELYMSSFNYYTSDIPREDIKFYYTTDDFAYRLGTWIFFSTENYEPHQYAEYYCTGGINTTEKSFAWSNGEYTLFEFDLREPEPVQEPLLITVCIHTIVVDLSTINSEQIVSCFVNDKNCGSVALVPSQKSMQFEIPEDAYNDKLKIKFQYSYLHEVGDLNIAVAISCLNINRGTISNTETNAETSTEQKAYVKISTFSRVLQGVRKYGFIGLIKEMCRRIILK